MSSGSTSAISQAPPDFPSKIGPYQVVGRLAKGGMAELFLGRRFGPQGFARSVAIKRILPHLAESENFVAMFLDEARIAAAIQHPNVVSVEDLANGEDGLYMVMEYLGGEALSALIRSLASRKQPIDPTVAVGIIAQAAAGLHAAHQLRDTDGRVLNIVHRDVSPHNLFITYEGAVKVLDFGIAQAVDRLTKTESGSVKGKWSYMAPEQIQNQPLDRRTDVFALGVVFYELLTLRRLFRRDTPAATVQALLNHTIRAPSKIRPGIPRELDAVCLKALERDPTKRYATAADFQRDLLQAIPRQTGALPEEQLRELMHGHFGARASAKLEMVRRVQQGADVADIVIDDQESGQSAVPRVASETLAAPPNPRGRRRPLLLGAAVVLAAAVGGLGAAAYFNSGGESVSEPAGTSPTETLALPAPSTTVSISVRSSPPGASILLDGEVVATTPGAVEVARGDSPVTLTFELDGHELLEEEITPDIDQRIRVRLRAEPVEEAPRETVRPSQNNDREPSMMHRPPVMNDPFQIWD